MRHSSVRHARAHGRSQRSHVDLKEWRTVYPILAEIHRPKREFTLPEGDATKERVASARDFFPELLGNGRVLEYNGDDS